MESMKAWTPMEIVVVDTLLQIWKRVKVILHEGMQLMQSAHVVPQCVLHKMQHFVGRLNSPINSFRYLRAYVCMCVCMCGWVVRVCVGGLCVCV